MNKDIINFYMIASKLKNVKRKGWEEVGISDAKVESVADHIYGSLVLAMALSSEKKLNLNMEKVFKMLIVKDLKKAILMKEESLNSIENNNDEELLKDLTESLLSKDEILSIYHEYKSLETPEAKFVLHISKLESDLQAKKYEQDGDFTLENAKEDVQKYPDALKDEILPQVEKASDGWLLYNRKYYENDETFLELSKDIQNL